MVLSTHLPAHRAVEVRVVSAHLPTEWTPAMGVVATHLAAHRAHAMRVVTTPHFHFVSGCHYLPPSTIQPLR
jgi:hypothetical protein